MYNFPQHRGRSGQSGWTLFIEESKRLVALCTANEASCVRIVVSAIIVYV